MNLQNINTNLKNMNVQKNIKITTSAIKQMLFLINLHHSKGIRISIKKSGCAGFKYIMQLVKIEKKEDIKIFTNNIFLYIDANYKNLIQGTKIDFIKNDINQYFKFDNKKLSSFCGCGESFSMN